MEPRPSDLPNDPAGDPLAGALLPVLLHRIRNVTQLVTAIRSVAELPDGADLLAGQAGTLAEAGRRSDEIGWLLGVLAGGAGTDVLLARREERGLGPLIELVREALAREERGLELMSAVPYLAADVAGGWQLPWTVAALACEGARALPAGEALGLSFERAGDGWWVRARGPASADRLAPIAARLPGSELRIEAEGWTLALPGPWLRPAD